MDTITIPCSDSLYIALSAISAKIRSASSWSEDDRVLISQEELERAKQWLERHPEIKLRGDIPNRRYSETMDWAIQSRERRKRVALKAGKRVTHAKWVRFGIR